MRRRNLLFVFMAVVAVIAVTVLCLSACADKLKIPDVPPDPPVVDEALKVESSEDFVPDPGLSESENNINRGVHKFNMVTESLSAFGSAITNMDLAGAGYVVASVRTKDLTIKLPNGQGDGVPSVNKFYIDFQMRLCLDDNDLTDIKFVLARSDDDATVLGLYYDSGNLYLNIAGDNGPKIMIRELNLGSLFNFSSQTTPPTDDENSGEETPDNSQSSSLIDEKGNITLGPISLNIYTLLNPLIKTVNVKTYANKKVFSIETDINAMVEGVVSLLNGFGGAGFISNMIKDGTIDGLIGQENFLKGLDIDAILISLFGLDLNALLNYPLDDIDLILTGTLNGTEGNYTIGGVDVDVAYGEGVNNFEFGIDLGVEYYGTSPSGIGSISFPSFADYERYMLTNLDVTFTIDFTNDADRSISVGSIFGSILEKFFGVDSIIPQTRFVVISGAKPAIIQHKQLTAQLLGGFG